VALSAAADPARPFQTLPLAGVKAPAEADLFTKAERNLMLFDGISTSKVAAGGICQIERLVTTSQTNAAGSADTSYLDATTMFTLMYARYSFRARVLSKYPRHKLANDDTRAAAGQPIVTPKLMKAEAVSWFRDLEALGLFEGFDQFKPDLVVARNATDPNRLDVLLPPDLINQLIVTAASIQFRL
jgi:phage tail sheath gpL-like